MKHIEGLIDRLRGARKETEIQVDIVLHDLNDPGVAAGYKLDPGYYFIVTPVEKRLTRDEKFSLWLQDQFLIMLSEAGLLNEERSVIIPVDNEGTYADPDNAWVTSRYIYDRRRKMMMVKAERLDPNIAYRLAIQMFRK